MTTERLPGTRLESSEAGAARRRLPWLTNGELLKAAEEAGFDVLLTTDKNLLYQQDLTGRKIAIVVLGKGRWRLIKPPSSH